MLVIVGGLPATGKTSLCRAVARETGAIHLRIDTIEQAIVDAGLGTQPLGPAGYVVAYALAREQLAQGRDVLADSVNPLAVTRDAWRAVADDAGVGAIEVEVVCSDPVEHRRRAQTREIDVPGLDRPTWSHIQARRYEAWVRAHLVVDTATATVSEVAASICRAMAAAQPTPAQPTPARRP